MTVAAFTVIGLMGAGIGCHHAGEADSVIGRITEQPSQTEAEAGQEKEEVTTPERQEKPVVTEPATPETTTPEQETQETTIPETTTPEQETGSVYEGQLPLSTDYFIIKEDADQFFEGSVFIGDSVMMGFRNYAMGQPQGFLGSPEFLVSGSFSLRMALARISESSIHPIYQGEQRYIWDSIAMMKAKKAFLFFGLNDIDMAGVEGTCANYAEVVENIRKASPETELFIISMTNVLTGSEVGGLNNANIRLLNEKVKEYCSTADVQFIDIASFLTDEDGGLKKEYCSDAYVHQTAAAYDIWTKVLRWYASGGDYLIPDEAETAAEAGTDAITGTAAETAEPPADEAGQETTPADEAGQETTPAPETAEAETGAANKGE